MIDCALEMLCNFILWLALILGALGLAAGAT